jgi:hypothetical protein
VSIPISNGKDKPLSAQQGHVPNISGAMDCWFQNMTFTLVSKSVKNFSLVEVNTNIDFMGVVSPNDQPLDMKAHGQRKWDSFDCYTQPGVPLVPDDIILYQGTKYRVMHKFNFELYGYVLYKLEQDYTGI